MKSRRSIFFFLVFWLSYTLLSGQTCTSPIPFPLGSNIISNQIQSTQYQWYVYTIPVSGTGELALVNSNDTSNYIDEVVIYNDDCNNLTAIDQVHITSWQAFVRIDFIPDSLLNKILIRTRRTKVGGKLFQYAIEVNIVAQGDPFLASVCTNGTIRAWGDNTFGQLGNGSSTPFSSNPVQVTGIVNATAVAIGSEHAVALTGNGLVYCWGNNNHGQLGQGVGPTTLPSSNTPVLVTLPLPAIAVAAGENFCIALLNNNTVFEWGAVDRYCTNGTYLEYFAPTAIPGYPPVIQIAACSYAKVFLFSNYSVEVIGTLYCGPTGAYNGSAATGLLSNVVAITAGHDQVMCIQSDGSLTGFSVNADGEIGSGTQNPGVYTVNNFAPCAGVLDVACGQQYCMAINNSGQVFGWGTDNFGAFGNCSLTSASAPQQYLSPVNTGLTAINDITIPVVGFSTMFRNNSGQVLTCGNDGLVGALGTGAVITSGSACSPQATPICARAATTVNISSSLASYCASDNITLTANVLPAGGTFIWSDQNCNTVAFGLGVNSITINAGAAAGNTYTVNYYVNNDGYIRGAKAQFIVNPTYCCAPTSAIVINNGNTSTLFPSGNANGLYIVVNGTLTVNSNITFVNCQIQMNTANSRINIVGSNTLNITQATHVFGCSVMWDRIEVPSGCTLNVNTNSRMEDAIYAVYSINGGVYNLNTAIFNRNKTSVFVGSYLTQNHPGIIQNCIFTSRVLPLNPTVLGVKASILSHPITNLKAPNSSSRPTAGVDISNNQLVSIGVPADKNQNLFDNLFYGIRSSNSGITVLCNAFQYMSGKVVCSPQTGCTTYGVAVHATDLNFAAASVVTIGGPLLYETNSVFDCFAGFILKGQFTNITISSNIVQCSATPPSTSGPSTYIGAEGINVQPSQTTNTLVEANSVINYVTGIRLARTNFSNATIKINSNIITADVFGYCSTGIHVTEPGNIAPPIAVYEVANNIVTDCNTCIHLLNVRKMFVTSNFCGIRYSTIANRRGIVGFGCKNVSLISNHIVGSSHAAAVVGGNINVSGIYLQNSSSMRVQCNLIEETARSMVFDGNCFSSFLSTSNTTGIIQNTMRNAQQGFVLKNSQAVIGQQGAPNPGGNTPSDNIWDLQNGSFSLFETYNNGANLANSWLYVKPGTTGLASEPSLNGGAPPYTLFLGYSNNITGTLPACSVLPPTPPPNSIIAQIEILAYDTTAYLAYTIETYWRHQKFVYDLLDEDTLLNCTPILNGFVAQLQGGATSKFLQIDKFIAFGSYQQAFQLNQTVQPQNIPEQNQKQFNFFFIHRLINPGLPITPIETNTLYSIANQCPLEGGNSVFQARSWITILENQVVEFSDICFDSSASERKGEGVANIDTVHQNAYYLYPNPTNGITRLEYGIAQQEGTLFEVFNTTGDLIYYSSLSQEPSSLLIDCSKWDDGMYLYRISLKGNTIGSGRWMVIK